LLLFALIILPKTGLGTEITTIKRLIAWVRVFSISGSQNNRLLQGWLNNCLS
jgi:hypothetical protein